MAIIFDCNFFRNCGPSVSNSPGISCRYRESSRRDWQSGLADLFRSAAEDRTFGARRHLEPPTEAAESPPGGEGGAAGAGVQVQGQVQIPASFTTWATWSLV